MIKKWLFIGLIAMTASLNAADIKWERFKQQMMIHHKDIPGWCSFEKAEKMMELVYQTRPKICVEIGVYAGSSIYPTACALRFLKEGVVYAIDPWSNKESIEGYEPNSPHYRYWETVDLEEIYKCFLAVVNWCRFTEYCQVLRMSSIEALPQFADESIDILHIDGNHSEEIALRDAQGYLPKLKKGGYLWFDDVNWESTSKAIELIMESCTLNEELSTATCFLFKKL